MNRILPGILLGLLLLPQFPINAAESAAPALENGFLNPPVTVQTATEIEIKP